MANQANRFYPFRTFGMHSRKLERKQNHLLNQISMRSFGSKKKQKILGGSHLNAICRYMRNVPRNLVARIVSR